MPANFQEELIKNLSHELIISLNTISLCLVQERGLDFFYLRFYVLIVYFHFRVTFYNFLTNTQYKGCGETLHGRYKLITG